MSNPPCGTTGGYTAHIKRREPTCQPCRTAQADWERHYRTRKYLAGGPMLIDSTGTRRRLQSLMRIGWPAHELGTRLGVSATAVRHWMDADRTVRRETAAKVARLYDELWSTPGPSVKTRARALANNWPPPMAYDDDKIDDPAARPSKMVAHRPAALDEIAVQRAARGERVRLSRAERAEVVRRLTAAGLSAADIADRLGIAQRSVSRLRKAA